MIPDEREIMNGRLDFISKRNEFLSNWVTREFEEVSKYLFLSNSGGAVAVLSFLGAVERYRSNPWLHCSLFLFALGLILVGCLRAQQYHRSERILYGYVGDLKSHFSGKLEWEAFVQQDEDRCKRSCLGYILGYGAFGCFILGIVTGGVALF